MVGLSIAQVGAYDFITLGAPGINKMVKMRNLANCFSELGFIAFNL